MANKNRTLRKKKKRDNLLFRIKYKRNKSK